MHINVAELNRLMRSQFLPSSYLVSLIEGEYVKLYYINIVLKAVLYI